MRTIIKLSEPPELVRHRAAGHADFDNYPYKDALRARLVEEQRGLCCFCGGRIRASREAMKVAHWLPQASHPEHQLDYWNLLGACVGNAGRPRAEQHCDTHQGSDLLSVNPANPAHQIECRVRYLPDGALTSDEPALRRELGEKLPDGTFAEGVLNLNLAFLRRNRFDALRAFTRTLNQRGGLSAETLRRLLARWSGEAPGELPAYAPVVAYWISKRLGRG